MGFEAVNNELDQISQDMLSSCDPKTRPPDQITRRDAIIREQLISKLPSKFHDAVAAFSQSIRPPVARALSISQPTARSLVPKRSRTWWNAQAPDLDRLWSSFVQRMRETADRIGFPLDTSRLVAPTGSLQSNLLVLMHWPPFVDANRYVSMAETNNMCVNLLSSKFGGLDDMLLMDIRPLQMTKNADYRRRPPWTDLPPQLIAVMDELVMQVLAASSAKAAVLCGAWVTSLYRQMHSTSQACTLINMPLFQRYDHMYIEATADSVARLVFPTYHPEAHLRGCHVLSAQKIEHILNAACALVHRQLSSQDFMAEFAKRRVEHLEELVNEGTKSMDDFCIALAWRAYELRCSTALDEAHLPARLTRYLDPLVTPRAFYDRLDPQAQAKYESLDNTVRERIRTELQQALSAALSHGDPITHRASLLPHILAKLLEEPLSTYTYYAQESWARAAICRRDAARYYTVVKSIDLYSDGLNLCRIAQLINIKRNFNETENPHLNRESQERSRARTAGREKMNMLPMEYAEYANYMDTSFVLRYRPHEAAQFTEERREAGLVALRLLNHMEKARQGKKDASRVSRRLDTLLKAVDAGTPVGRFRDKLKAWWAAGERIFHVNVVPLVPGDLVSKLPQQLRVFHPQGSTKSFFQKRD